jgi:chromosome segregation ATPase
MVCEQNDQLKNQIVSISGMMEEKDGRLALFQNKISSMKEVMDLEHEIRGQIYDVVNLVNNDVKEGEERLVQTENEIRSMKLMLESEEERWADVQNEIVSMKAQMKVIWEQNDQLKNEVVSRKRR